MRVGTVKLFIQVYIFKSTCVFCHWCYSNFLEKYLYVFLTSFFLNLGSASLWKTKSKVLCSLLFSFLSSTVATSFRYTWMGYWLCLWKWHLLGFYSGSVILLVRFCDAPVSKYLWKDYTEIESREQMGQKLGMGAGKCGAIITYHNT